MLLVFSFGQHHPYYFEMWMKSKATKNKSKFKHMKPFPESCGFPLAPSPQWKKQRKEEAFPSPEADSPQYHNSMGQPTAARAIVTFTFTPHRQRDSAKGLGHQPEWATEQTSQNCQGCSMPWAVFDAQRYFPSVFLVNDVVRCATLTGRKARALSRADYVHSVVDSNDTSGRVSNIAGKWERTSAVLYIIFQSYSPLAHPHLGTVTM